MVSLCTLFYVAESCQKNMGTPSGSQSLASAISSLQAIAVGSTTSSVSALDSIYVIRTCSAHSTKDSVAFSSLPSSVTDYLNASYAGYMAQQAYSVTDLSGAAAGYIVIIQYNGNPVGLKFDASGNFVSVLAQKSGRELEGCMNGDGDSTFTHHEHLSDSTEIHEGHDSTHVHDRNDSTHYDHDSTHHH